MAHVVKTVKYAAILIGLSFPPHVVRPVLNVVEVRMIDVVVDAMCAGHGSWVTIFIF